MNINTQSEYGRRLIRLGILLLLLGLITGFLIPVLKNPRMGLSSHLEGTMNGMLLIIFGLIWPLLTLKEGSLRWCFGLSLFGTYTNWFTTLLSALWGAGSEMMPLAGGGLQGEIWQEYIVKAGLISLSVSMVLVCVMLFFGMNGKLKK